ncbi:TaqI-like C-terminal specificity domain-containing protein, partial [Synergistes jonesii]
LINTHNGVKENGQVKIPRIKIDDYPTLRSHFDKYGERLVHRADQGDTPYNLRNCAYLEDFLKPKIIYPNMTKYLPFVYDSKGFITNQKCFIVTGLYTAFLTAFFNSSLFKFCFRDSFPELQGETRELSKIFFDKIPVPIPNEKIGMQFEVLVSDIQKEYTKQKAINIDQLLFDLYKLTQEERQAIGFVEID